MSGILIAVPTFESIDPETFKSIYGLAKPDDCYVQFDFVRGYDCARARNLIAREAMSYGFDYVLMVDSDIVLPCGTLLRMMKDPVDICLGCYPRKRSQDGTMEIFRLGQDNFVDTFKASDFDDMNDRIIVKGGGFGCAFLNVEIFNKMPYPWFKYVEYNNGETLSEDNYFCSQAAKAGYLIHADAGVRCGHATKTTHWR